MATTTYKVTGMTCGHCVNAVTSELSGLDGVTAVTVDLVPDGVSLVTVTSAAPLPAGAVTEALDEAGGYLLSPLPDARPRPMADADDVRRLALALPGVAEIDSDGFDFRVDGKGFVWSYPERRPGQRRVIRTDIAVLFVGDEAEKQALLLGEPGSSSPRPVTTAGPWCWSGWRRWTPHAWKNW